MPSKLPQVNIRFGYDTLKSIKNLHRASNLVLEERKEKPVSFNTFINDIMINFLVSEDSRFLRKIYAERLYAQDKEKMMSAMKKRIQNALTEEEW